MIEFAYGLDFGTSKTALCFAKCGGPRPPVRDVPLTDRGEGRTASCILRGPDGTVAGVGTPAEEHYWTFLSDDERRAHAFDANFKPHVPTDPRAERNGREFLAALRGSDAVRRELDPPASRVTIVGRPTAWNEEAERRLLSIVAESGFPQPRALPEPVGALFDFLCSELRAEDVEKDILVIDWGAGTCSFNVMRRGKPSEEDSWGSALYGGRLFDDLIYQWFVEQARDDEAHRQDLDDVLSDAALEGTLRQFRARELKEEFSIWARKPLRPFRSRLVEVGTKELGRLHASSLSEFQDRARRYVPTKAMRQRLVDLGKDALPVDRPWLENMLAGRPVDLIGWGEELVGRGGRGALRPTDIQVVISAGGSTLWPWFQDLIRTPGTYSPSAQFYTDNAPQLTIARGLASAFAVGSHARELVERIGKKKDAMVAALRSTFLEPRAERIALEVIDRFLDDRYLSAVQPAISELKEGKTDAALIRAQLEGEFRRWIDAEGADAIREALRRVNEESPEEVRRVAEAHGVRVEGLLRLAVDVCSPFGAEDWVGWLSSSGLFHDLVGDLRRTPLDDVWDGILFVVALPFKIIHVAVETVVSLFDSEEQRVLRQSRAREEQRERERQQAQQGYDTVRTRLVRSFRDTLQKHPALSQWATHMVDFLAQRLDVVARLAGT